MAREGIFLKDFRKWRNFSRALFILRSLNSVLLESFKSLKPARRLLQFIVHYVICVIINISYYPLARFSDLHLSPYGKLFKPHYCVPYWIKKCSMNNHAYIIISSPIRKKKQICCYELNCKFIFNHECHELNFKIIY